MITYNSLDKGKYWNIAWSLVDGCTPKSDACKNCWLAMINSRFGKGRDFSKIVPRYDRLDIPERKTKPTVFSVWSDLFHEEIPYEFISEAFVEMLDNPRHRYFVCTKRPERMATFFEERKVSDSVFLGTTVENQETADLRIPELLKVFGFFKFLSVEPILGPVSIEKYHKGIGLVICGAESGAGYRETKDEWVRALKDECVKYGVMFFLKQLRRGGILVKAPKFDDKQWLDLPQP